MPENPTLLADSRDWNRLRKLKKEDPAFASATAALEASARALLVTPLRPFQRDEGGGRRFLDSARRILANVLRLGMAYHLTGEEAFALRAKEQIDLAVRAPDWNPSHFLDTAETALAVALGLAWLRDEIDDETRSRWQDALIEKALRPSFDGSSEHTGWMDTSNNWIQVCHSGLVAAALMVADREPELTRQTITRAIHAQQRVAKQYAPDGAYVEGPNYWEYGTTYAVLLIEFLRKNFDGHSYGLETMPGFLSSGTFYRHMILPSNQQFSYGDSRPRVSASIAAPWFARETGHAQIAQGDLATAIQTLKKEGAETPIQISKPYLPITLLWYAKTNKGQSPMAAPLDLQWIGRGINPVAVARTSWEDPLAAAFAMKGGGTEIPHAHMDAGAFVYEVGGVRWAEDLGMHDYARLELKGVDLWNSAQNADRWKLFRLGPDGHNILRFEERPQVAGSLATQLEMQTTESGWDFSLDLSPVYSGQAKSVRRTAHLGRRGDLMVRDEWKNALTSPIHWQWITSAEVSLREEGIVLEKDGRQIRLLIRSSHPAEVTIQNAEDLLHPKEDPLPCIRRIRITLPEAADSGWIEVRASEQTPSANPLSR